MATTQGYCILFWTNPGSSTQQNKSCTTTYLPSHNQPTRPTEQYWKSRDKLKSDALRWTSTNGCTNVGRPIGLQLCVYTGCRLEHLSGAMDEWDQWRTILEIYFDELLRLMDGWMDGWRERECVCVWEREIKVWCNGYRRRKWTRRHEFKSWTRLIAFHIALIPLGKVWIQLFSLQLWVNSRTDWVLQPWSGN